MKSNKFTIAVLGIAIVLLGAIGSGCSPLNRAQRGAAIGAGAGATVGAVIGKTAGNTALGAIIGGAIGGTAGAYIGHTMGNQEYKVKGAQVVSENNLIIVKFNSGLLFDQGSVDLKPETQSNLGNLAQEMQKTPSTAITVIGYTDSLGTADYNIDLSKKRAEAIKSALVADGVNDGRITTVGKGEAEPITSNSTEEGRAKNRRVVIILSAGRDLKDKTAKNSQ